MLSPHKRSLLYFITECLRVLDEEEQDLPSWMCPDVVSAALSAPHFAGYYSSAVLQRQADRSRELTDITRQLARTKLEELGVATPSDDVLDFVATMLRHLLFVPNGSEQSAPQASKGGSPDPKPKAVRPHVVEALVGLYCGAGNGERARTAAIARTGIPKGEATHGGAQYWNVRNALCNYIAQLTMRWPVDWRVLEIMSLVALHRVSLAQAAWNRLQASGDYRQSRHVEIVERLVSSGELAVWLHDAPQWSSVGERGLSQQQTAAENHLVLFAMEEFFRRLQTEQRKRGIDVLKPYRRGSKRNFEPGTVENPHRKAAP